MAPNTMSAVGAVQDLLDDTPLVTAAAVALVLLAVLVAVILVLRRLRRRQRRELYDTAIEAIETLLATPLGTGGVTPDGHRADDTRAATDQARTTLTELERISRFETSAAALALRHHTGELGKVLESRLRGEGDPYVLDVRITELGERVRGARDRLGSAVRR